MMRSFYDAGRHGAQRSSAVRAPRRRVRRRRRVARAPGHLARRSPRPRPAWQDGAEQSIDALFDEVESQFVDAWQVDAGLKTYGEAVADLLEFREREGEPLDMSAGGVARSSPRARRCTPRGRRRKELGADVAGTASGRRRPRATTRSAAASRTRSPSRWPPRRSPTSSGWRPRPPTSPTPSSSPTRSTPSYPDKMLAYNLSPSFNWDTTGMTDDEMRAFPEELGKMGFVFNFITYGGHQVDGVACRGVRHGAATGRHAGAGPPAAQDAPRRIALPHTANPGRRAAQRRRAGRVVGAHGDDQVDGQGLDAAPASGADRGAEEAARGVAGAVERALPARREAARAAAAAAGPARDVLDLGIYGDGRRRSRWPTSSSTRSRTGTAAASSRCATRTRSPRSCARSA